jgi:1,4-dihydroxy-6-naphthoate synthase
VAHALARPAESTEFVREHAQELSPDVMRRHIELYVNDYTLDLDEAAVTAMLRFGEDEGFFPSSERGLFAY